MPSVVIPAALSAAFGATALGVTLGISTFAAGALIFAANIALGFISQALAPKPKVPNLRGFETSSRDRLVQVRQPVTPWKTIYGEVRVSGPMTYLDTTDDNKYIHMLITLTSHEIEAIETVFFNDVAISADDMDGSGNVTGGKYNGKARIQKSLGGEGAAQPFPDLESESSGWTSSHFQQGHAKLYVRLEYDRDIFPSRIPNISAWVKGKKVTDPRNSSTVAWSPNPALCLRDYLVTSTVNTGSGATTLEINDTFTNAAANSSDEIVSTQSITLNMDSVDTGTDVMTLSGSTSRFYTGDRVVVSSIGGSVPAGLSAGTPYYTIPTQRHTTVRTKLATSYANAVTGTQIDITGSGSGTIKIIKTGEPRYSLTGVIESDKQPHTIISEMLTSMGGRAVFASGQWRIMAAAWSSSTLTIDEDEIIGQIQVQTKQGRKDRFNAVKGIYVSVLNLDQPSDYPPVTNSTYETEDNGERMFRELDLPFTNRPHMAQRLAKIELERHRQQITVSCALNLKGLQVQAGDVLSLTNSRFGWSAKEFEIVEWKLALAGDPPVLACEVKLRETASGVFDWNSGLETTVDPALNTNNPDIFTVSAPEALNVTETIYDTRGSAGVKAKARFFWTAPAGALIEQYSIQLQKIQDKNGSAVTEDYQQSGETINTSFEYLDIEPGIYNFRVRSINNWGVRSAYATHSSHEISGLLDEPTEPQNLNISSIGGLAYLRWDATPNLDVKVGGTYVFRHSSDLATATWGTSVGIGAAIPGSETTAVLPLKSGTYLVKAVDSSGVESLAYASVSSKQATVQAFTTASTITESTVFPGSTTNVIVDSGTITIGASGLVDSIAAIDSVSNWDFYGGLVPSGTYVFGTAFDWGTVVSRRYTTDIDAVITNLSDLIDDRVNNMDLWADFDGATSGAADARVYVSETDDNPAGSPTWSSYNLLESAELTARAVRFKCILSTTDTAFTINVSKLEVVAASAA